jgi:mRNA-degrading endonuclease RelE of RelBE toxin-antitoxin system
MSARAGCVPTRTYAATSALPELVVTNKAEETLASLADDVRDAIDLDILKVGANPQDEGHHLKGTFYCRWSSYTAGNRRILYRIEPGRRERVVILGIPPRKNAYPRSRH